MYFMTNFEENLAFATSLVMGVTMVMGVSAITSAPSYMTDYYKYASNNPDAVPQNAKFWETVLTFYVVVTMVTQTIFEPVNLTTFCCRLSLMFRLIVSCLLMLVELLVVLLLPTSHISEKGAMAALMLMAFLGGFARAFYENTGYALFGPCPPKFISGFVIGAAISGLLTSILEIIIKASMSDEFESVKRQSYIYFSIASAIIIVTMIMILALLNNNYAKEYIAEFRSKRGVLKNIYRKRKGKLPTYPVDGNEIGAVVPQYNDLHRTRSSDDDNADDEFDNAPTTAELLQQVRLWDIVKKIYPMQFACFFTYFATYLLFPGVLLAVDPDDSWYGTIVMAVFNAADLVGRLCCLIRAFWPPRKWVIIGTVLRLLLFPLMILCAKGIIPTYSPAYIIAGILGVTNGFFATISVTYAPESEGINTDGERAIAGQATGASLLFGVASGSLLQLAIALKL